MTKREKFYEWIRANPERMEQILAVATEDEGMTRKQFRGMLLELANYLVKIEETKKTYRKWDQFILRNMPSKKKRRYGKKQRPEPSTFGDTENSRGLPGSE